MGKKETFEPANCLAPVSILGLRMVSLAFITSVRVAIVGAPLPTFPPTLTSSETGTLFPLGLFTPKTHLEIGTYIDSINI